MSNSKTDMVVTSVHLECDLLYQMVELPVQERFSSEKASTVSSPCRNRVYLALFRQANRQQPGKAKADFKQNSRKLQAVLIIRYDGSGTAAGRTGTPCDAAFPRAVAKRGYA